jgi:hypothetical protein
VDEVIERKVRILKRYMHPFFNHAISFFSPRRFFAPYVVLPLVHYLDLMGT